MNVPGVGKTAYESGRQYYLAQKELAKAMGKEFPKPIQVLKSIDKHSGEVFNILITAVGTAFVAPFFIAYNPLSKTDEDTKKYSAMRQPVSAVLAVATQAGLVIPWNKLCRYLSNNGKLGDNKIGNFFNQQGMQDPKYILSELKKKHPNATKAQLDAMVKGVQADQFAKLFAEFSEHGTMTIGKHKLSDKEVRGLIADVAGDFINKADESKARYDGEKYTNQLRRAEYLHNAKENNVLENIQKLREGVMSKTGNEEVIKYLKDTIKEAKKNSGGEVNEWIRILENDLLPTGKKADVLGKLDKIKAITESCQGKDFLQIRAGIMQHSSEKVRDVLADKAFYESIQKAAKEGTLSVPELVDKLRSIKDDHAVAAVIDKYGTKVSRRMKAFSAVTGLVVSLAIMPATCCALNYLYPRFMDKFFPELSKKKQEGGKKCQ